MRTALLSIQYLRAFAAFLVVLAHIGWFNSLWGQQGVDIFFIISGFIMAHVALREPLPSAFLWARFQRVAPLYWVATIAWFFIHPTHDLRHVMMSLAFIPHLGPAHMIWPLIEQGWTLLYEVAFYGIFAVALLLPNHARLSFTTIVLTSLVALGWVARSDSALAQVYLSPLLVEFLAGLWLHRAWQGGWLERPTLGAIAVLTAAVAFIALRDVNPYGWRFLMWGLPALLLVAGTLALERLLPRLSWMLLLGDASYAIYLTHRFVLPTLIAEARPLPTLAAVAVIMTGCAIVGIIVHRLVEKPIARLSRAVPIAAAA